MLALNELSSGESDMRRIQFNQNEPRRAAAQFCWMGNFIAVEDGAPYGRGSFLYVTAQRVLPVRNIQGKYCRHAQPFSRARATNTTIGVGAHSTQEGGAMRTRILRVVVVLSAFSFPSFVGGQTRNATPSLAANERALA